MKRMSFAEYVERSESEGFRLIDVREDYEFEEVRAVGAEPFALSRIQRGQMPDDDGRPVALICRSGRRSEVAALILESKGFPECTNVEGGTLAAIAFDEAWVERG